MGEISPEDVYGPFPIKREQFRLLILDQSGKNGGQDDSDCEHDQDAPITGRLKVVSFDDHPKYATISYAWGSQKDRGCLQLDTGPFDISLTVEKILRHVRALGVRRIWLDQICINQTNTRERNAQVLLMKEIYKNSKECFVYLGEGTGEPGDVKWLLDWVEYNRDYREMKTLLVRKFRVALGDRKPWKACMFYIMEQSYFTRLWVLQELHFSKNITCLVGKDTFNWDIIRALVKEIPISQSLSSNAAFKSYAPDSSSIGDLDELNILLPKPSKEKMARSEALERFSSFVELIEGLQNDDSRSLFSLLSLSRDLSASDARDKIYALLNLADDRHLYPEPDYSCNQREVYTQFANGFSKNGYSAQLLSSSGHHVSPFPWPSWIPNWTNAIAEFTFQSNTKFRAGGKKSSCISQAVPGSLLVEAHCCDQILETFCRKPDTDSLCRDIATMVVETAGSITFEPHEPGQSLDKTKAEDLVDLLFCDPLDYDAKTFNLRAAGDQVGDFTHVLQSALARMGAKGSLTRWDLVKEAEGALGSLSTKVFRDKEKWSKVKHTLLNVSPIETYIREQARRYLLGTRGLPYFKYLKGEQQPLRMFLTHEGRLGFASASCKRGDRIAIIKGAKAPFIFRKCGTRKYHNLGEAYVRGLMNGEILKKDNFRFTTKEIV